MIEISQSRFKKIISDYNDLYILIDDSETEFASTENRAFARKSIKTEYSSTISSIEVSGQREIKESQAKTDNYFFLVTIAIFLFIAFIIMYYFNKLLK
jgi:hypothetical protein